MSNTPVETILNEDIFKEAVVKFKAKGYHFFEDIIEDIDAAIDNVYSTEEQKEIPGLVNQIKRKLKQQIPKDAKLPDATKFIKPADQKDPIVNYIKQEQIDVIGNTGKVKGSWENVKLDDNNLLKVLEQSKVVYGFNFDDKKSKKIKFNHILNSPVVKLDNIDCSILRTPVKKFRYNSAVTRNKSYEKMQHLIGGEVTCTTASPYFNGKIKSTFCNSNEKIHKSEKVCATVDIKCCQTTVVLKDKLKLQEAAIKIIEEAARCKNLSKRYFALMKAGNELGMYVVQEIDIGVSACGYFSGTVSEDISVADFEASLVAAATLPQPPIEGAAFRFDQQKKNSIESISQSLRWEVIGANCCVQTGDYSVLFPHAGKVESLDCITISNYTTIFDLLEGELKEKVWEAINWHDSWLGYQPIFDTCEYWMDISPIDYSGFTVWYENGVHAVYCRSFEKKIDALQFFKEKNQACILCQWNDGEESKMEELAYYTGWNTGALETCRAQAKKYYEIQLKNRQDVLTGIPKW